MFTIVQVPLMIISKTFSQVFSYMNVQLFNRWVHLNLIYSNFLYRYFFLAVHYKLPYEIRISLVTGRNHGNGKKITKR